MPVLLRHRVVGALLLMLTFAITALVYHNEPRTYRASSSIVFIPSQSFGVVTGAGNRYLAFTTSLNQLGDVIRYEVSSSAEASTLATAGYTSSYAVTDPTDTSAPILLVTATGGREQNVENTLTSVDSAITSELAATQSGMKPADRITAKVLTFMSEPTSVSSAKDRTAIAVLLGGLVLSYLVLLALDSLQTRHQGKDSETHGGGEPAPEERRTPSHSLKQRQDGALTAHNDGGFDRSFRPEPSFRGRKFAPGTDRPDHRTAQPDQNAAWRPY